MEGLLSAKELADFLGCGRLHVYELVRQGCPHIRLGSGQKSPYRFSLPRVMEWLKKFSGGVEEPAEGGVKAEVYDPEYNWTG